MVYIWLIFKTVWWTLSSSCQSVHLCDLASRLLLQIQVWEEAEMDKPMEIDEIRVDPSPFQLVERTSLHKVGFWKMKINMHHRSQQAKPSVTASWRDITSLLWFTFPKNRIIGGDKYAKSGRGQLLCHSTVTWVNLSLKRVGPWFPVYLTCQ